MINSTSWNNSPSKSIAEPGQRSLEQYLEEHTPCPQPKDHTEPAKVSRKGSNLPSADNPSNANSANEPVVIDLEPESDTALTTRAIANSSIPVSLQRMISLHNI